jgi:glucose-6-phosphate 1-dehydrogenase
MSGVGPRAHTLVPLTLTAELPPAELPTYGRLLLDVFNRDPTLSVRGDEAEESWRVVTPVLAAWEKDPVPLQEYAPARTDRPISPSAELRSYRVDADVRRAGRVTRA